MVSIIPLSIAQRLDKMGLDLGIRQQKIKDWFGTAAKTRFDRTEQKVLKIYAGIMSKEMMHSLENLRGIPKQLNSTLHLSTIRREWDAFYRQNPTTTLQKLLEKATEIDQKYGHLFNPPIGKK